jgi:glycosyltransferase involved in cell wall biosynthesis
VLDDCGTDSSIDIVREYQQTHPRGKDIHIVRQPQNMGIGEARNRIVDEAQGTYFYFLDGDDSIDPNTIELLYKEAKAFDADLVYGSYQRIELFDGEAKKEDYSYQRQVFLQEDEFADRVYSDYGFLQAMTWNVLIKKEIYVKNNIRYKAVNYWEDFSTTIDLPTYVTRVVLLPDITYFYYCRYGSLSNFSKRDHIAKDEILGTIGAMGQVKQGWQRVKDKPYFHKWLYKVMMTHFYIVCSILKQQEIIAPPFTDCEVRDVMRSPLTFNDLLCLKGWRGKNLSLYLIGALPAFVSVALVRLLGKSKGLL